MLDALGGASLTSEDKRRHPDMEWLPVIIMIPALCFAAAYGLQKRKLWAWYAGWVFLFFTAGAVAYYTMAMLSNADSLQQFGVFGVFTAGGAALWTLFAVRWAGLRKEFSR